MHDGIEYSASAYGMTIDVTPVQDAPTAAANTVTTNEDTTYTFTAADFNFADVDSGDSLTKIQVTGLESVGTLELSSVDVELNDEILLAQIGNLVFTPVSDANGAPYDTFTFKVHDGTEYSSSSYTMRIDVTAQQDAPTASNSTRSRATARVSDHDRREHRLGKRGVAGAAHGAAGGSAVGAASETGAGAGARPGA